MDSKDKKKNTAGIGGERDTVPYEGGTYDADAAGYFGGVDNPEGVGLRTAGERRVTEAYEPNTDYGTEAADDLFAGAMYSGFDPLGSYTGSGLTPFGNRPVYFPPHDDEIIPVQDADDL